MDELIRARYSLVRSAILATSSGETSHELRALEDAVHRCGDAFPTTAEGFDALIDAALTAAHRSCCG